MKEKVKELIRNREEWVVQTNGNYQVEMMNAGQKKGKKRKEGKGSTNNLALSAN